VHVLDTERLSLRRLDAGDADFIVELLNQPSFIANIGDRGVRTADDARRYIEDGPVASYERFGFGLFLVALKATGEPIGICGLLKRDTLPDVDVGFALLPQFWSRGYAIECATAVTAWGRDVLALPRIVAIVNPANAASIRVLGKMGFAFERLVRVRDDAPEIELHALNF